MKPNITAEQIKAQLGLTPLPLEGGLVSSSFVSDETLPETALAGRVGEHPVCSAIYYFLTGKGFSRMHRLPSEEIFHFYMGDSVEMLQLYPDGTGKVIRMGHDILNGEQVQVTVPRNCWQGTRLVSGGSWALLGTTMAPGYRPQDYEDGCRETLLAQYPQFDELLESLTAATITE